MRKIKVGTPRPPSAASNPLWFGGWGLRHVSNAVLRAKVKAPLPLGFSAPQYIWLSPSRSYCNPHSLLWVSTRLWALHVAPANRLQSPPISFCHSFSSVNTRRWSDFCYCLATRVKLCFLLHASLLVPGIPPLLSLQDFPRCRLIVFVSPFKSLRIHAGDSLTGREVSLPIPSILQCGHSCKLVYITSTMVALHIQPQN
jgi:hypothetical protein